jgi:hypothetical protein
MFRCEAALDPLADIAQRESRRPLYRNSSTSATSKGQKRTHTNNPGGPGFVCLGGKLEETIRVTAIPSRHLLNSAIVTFIPLVRRLVALPEFFEPTDEPTTLVTALQAPSGSPH